MRVSILSIVAAALAAQAADQPSFEAASVKRADPAQRSLGSNTCTGGPGTSDPSMLRCTNAALSPFVMLAYDEKAYTIVSPDWVILGGADNGYDITAKIPPGTTKEQYRLMLQRLLAERFHLKAHRETRELPVYAIVRGKGQPKMTPSAGPAPPGSRFAQSFTNNHFRWTMRDYKIADLAGGLESQLWSPVTDETGLAGEYDFTLEFVPSERWQMKTGWAPSGEGADGPSLFTAISEQLGLKLESRKGPVPVLVVDSADKVPVAN